MFGTRLRKENNRRVGAKLWNTREKGAARKGPRKKIHGSPPPLCIGWGVLVLALEGVHAGWEEIARTRDPRMCARTSPTEVGHIGKEGRGGGGGRNPPWVGHGGPCQQDGEGRLGGRIRESRTTDAPMEHLCRFSLKQRRSYVCAALRPRPARADLNVAKI